MKSIKERFETKFKKLKGSNPCWEWQNRISPFGYGQFSISSGNTWQAHRLAYKLYVGEIPKGMCVLHRCDNRKCINPGHLWVGTQAENVKDMMEKGRGIKAVPEKNGGHKINWNVVNQIRELYPQIKSMRRLEKKFNISRRQVGRIIHNISWRI